MSYLGPLRKPFQPNRGQDSGAVPIFSRLKEARLPSNVKSFAQDQSRSLADDALVKSATSTSSDQQVQNESAQHLSSGHFSQHGQIVQASSLRDGSEPSRTQQIKSIQSGSLNPSDKNGKEAIQPVVGKGNGWHPPSRTTLPNPLRSIASGDRAENIWASQAQPAQRYSALRKAEPSQSSNEGGTGNRPCNTFHSPSHLAQTASSDAQDDVVTRPPRYDMTRPAYPLTQEFSTGKATDSTSGPLSPEAASLVITSMQTFIMNCVKEIGSLNARTSEMKDRIASTENTLSATFKQNEADKSKLCDLVEHARHVIGGGEQLIRIWEDHKAQYEHNAVSLNQELELYKEKLGEQEGIINDPDLGIKALQSRMEALINTLQQLKEMANKAMQARLEADSLLHNNQQLQSKISAMELASIEHKNSECSLQKDLQLSREQREESAKALEHSNSMLRKAESRASEIEKKILVTEKELEKKTEVHAVVLDEKSSRIEVLEKQKESAEKKMKEFIASGQRLKTENDQLKKSADSERESGAELKRRLQELEEVSKARAYDQEKSSVLIADVCRDLDCTRQTLQQRTEEKQMLEADIDSLQVNLRAEQKRITELQEKVKSMLKVETELRKKDEALHAAINSLNEVKQDLNQAHAEVHTEKGKKSSLEAQLRRLTEKYECETAKFRDDIRDLYEQLDQRKGTLDLEKKQSFHLKGLSDKTGNASGTGVHEEQLRRDNEKLQIEMAQQCDRIRSTEEERRTLFKFIQRICEERGAHEGSLETLPERWKEDKLTEDERRIKQLVQTYMLETENESAPVRQQSKVMDTGDQYARSHGSHAPIDAETRDENPSKQLARRGTRVKTTKRKPDLAAQSLESDEDMLLEEPKKKRRMTARCTLRSTKSQASGENNKQQRSHSETGGSTQSGSLVRHNERAESSRPIVEGSPTGEEGEVVE